MPAWPTHPITATEFAAVCPTLPCKDLSAYRVESLLGGGGFSHVVLAREAHPDAAGSGNNGNGSGASSEPWALKLIPAPDAQCLADVDRAPLILTEARIHLLMSSEPSVLPCLEAFKSVFADESLGGAGGGAGVDASRATYMAVLRMPVAACSVEEWLFSAAPAAPAAACQNVGGGPRGGHVDETEVLTVWLQMVNAVYRCHAHGVVHHDVKLPNFLMDARGKVQIMDFGLACVEGVTPRAIAGTPWTMSPAGFKHGDDGRAGDWWSLGVVLYQLLQGGCWPFKSCWWPWQKGGGQRMEDAIRKAVLAGRISWHRNGSAGVSEGCKALVRGLLQPDPNRRWQLRQVLAAEVVTPQMLAGIGARFPELEQDMQALLTLQRRARGVQALGSDGGAAAAAAAATAAAPPGIAHMAAGVKAGAASLLAAAAAAASHAPHWPGGAGARHLPDGGSYQPLLSDGSSAAGTLSPATASFMGPGAGASASRPAASAAASAPPAAAATANPQQQQQQKPARVDDLLLLFDDEVPNAHPSPPPTPPSASRAHAFPDELGRTSGQAGAAATSSSKQPHPSRHGSQGSGTLRHACTTGSLADAAAGPTASSSSGGHHGHHGSSLEPALSGPGGGGGGGLDSTAGGGISASALSGASLSPSGRVSHPAPGGAGGSAAPLPLRGSRTSLQDLFGPNPSVPLGPRLNILERLSSGHPAGGAGAGAAHGPAAQQHQHQHHHQQRVMSGGALGGLLGSAADLFGGLGGGGGAGGRPTLRRRSWGPLGEPLTLDVGGGARGGDGGGTLPGAAAGSHELLHSPSSWVPPPPEAFHRVSAGSRRRSDTGAGGGPGGAGLPGGLGSPGLRHGGPPRSRSFVARAKALFSDCLPGKKSSMVLYDVYEEVGEEEYVGLQS